MWIWGLGVRFGFRREICNFVGGLIEILCVENKIKGESRRGRKENY